MKSHQLFRLTQKLYGVPHLVSQQSFENITSYLSLRNSGLMLPAAQEDSEQEEQDSNDQGSETPPSGGSVHRHASGERG